MKPISSQEKNTGENLVTDYNSALLLAQIKPSILFEFNEDRSIYLTDKKKRNRLEELGVFSIYSVNREIVSSSNYRKFNAPIILNLKPNIDAAQIIDELRATGLFIFVELDQYYQADGSCYLKPNDSLFNKQWSFAYDAGTALCKNAGIEMDLAWLIEKGDTSTIVCIIDSGIKTDHGEFDGRIWQNPKEVAGNDIDDDGNGLVDDVNGWNYTNNDNDIRDDEGHGTSIAGIIAANGNNYTGLAGINWYCKIMPLKVLKGSFASYADITSAIYYAVANKADVINISIGGTTTSSSVDVACKYAKALKIPVVVSMGNENTWRPKYPAAYASTIAVGSTDCTNARSLYAGSTGSNYGEHIDIVAPGSSIISLSHSSNTDYSKLIYGTSFATPHVVGVISLMKALNDTISVDSIKSLLFLGARDTVGPKSEDSVGWDQYFGHGSLNAFNTLSLMVSGIDIPIKRNIKVESCEQYISPSGKYTWTSTGSYLDTIEGKVGCDTFIFANVVIHKPDLILDTIKSCGPFTSPSGRYVWKTSGIYRDTIFTPNKCDKVWLVNLKVHDITTTNLNVSACDVYNTPSGKFTFNKSGMYRDTISDAFGCDSILVINLKVNHNADTTFKKTACREHKSPSGQYIWNYSGKFKDVIKTKQGCDSTINVDLTIEQLTTNVDYIWPNLKADIDQANYQWLDCDNDFAIITGANNQLYRPTVDGAYAVEVRKNSCIDTSSCYNVTTSGTGNISENHIQLYPNPTSGEIFIQNPNHIHLVWAQVKDIHGKVLMQMDLSTSTEIAINLLGAAGYYHIELFSADGEMHRFMVLKNVVER